MVHGKKKLRALVKKAGDAAEANANEFARAARGMNALDDDLREMRRREGEFASNERAMKEVLEALNAVASELRGVKDELAALRRERGRGDDVKSALLGGKKANIVVKSDEEMFAALTGGKSLEREVEAAAPVLDVTSWRGDGTDRSSEWPLVMKGEDDIYLMTIVHAKLNDAGFWAGEEDEDDMYFGASTMDALLYFQAAAGVPESGVVDPETWSALLGIEAFVWGPAPGAIAFDETKFSSQMEARGTPTLVAKSKSTPVAPKAPNLAEEDYDPDSYDPFGDDDERGAAQGPSFTLGTTKGKENKFKWPILREDDGGVMVHKLQIALSEKGFDSGEEDMEYWYFGLTTQAAVLTFQSSARLPETGTTDIATWRALLGDELMELDPKVALSRISDGLYPNDLTRTDRVFLLGEGRYEKR